MSKIGDLRAGLKANLDVIPGVNVSRYARHNPIGRLIHLWPTAVVYHRANAMGLQEVSFTVQAVAQFTDEPGPQDFLDSLMDGAGPMSVLAAIEADKTLGGECDRLQAVSTGGYEFSVTLANEPRLTADWAVTVWVGTA